MSEMLPSVPTGEPDRRETVAKWKAIVAQFEVPHAGRATWQLVNTVGTYGALWALIYWSLTVSWWLTIPFVILAGGILVRVFIIFHDCGHGSFFKSPIANTIWGFITGVLTFSPYYHWKWEHAVHHATSGNLDRRGTGDIWTLTVEEYLKASRWKRFAYRLARNPFVLFVIGPLFVFLVRHRFTSPGARLRARASVWGTNLGLVLMAWGLISLFGWLPSLIIQLSILAVAGSAGIWLFYVQHQFEEAYWERAGDWDYTSAALKGSSFYKLPKVLQWFTGNIGFHHIHHLSHRIPNYNLERCHRSDPLFSQVRTLSILQSLKSLRYRLWDEASARLVGFRHLRKRRQSPGKHG